jgi:hypothetical protein
MTFKLLLASEAGTAGTSAESDPKYGWRNTEVRIRFTDPATNLILDAVVANPTAAGELTSPWNLVAPIRAELLHVRRFAPHRYPFQWTPAKPVPITDGASLTPIERRRISAWANPSRLSDAQTLDLSAAFQGHSLNGLDEVSLVSTVFLDPDNRIDWAADYPGKEMRAVILDFHRPDKKVPVKQLDPAQRKQILDSALLTLTSNLIKRLHGKRVQVFAGFYVDSGNPDQVAKDHAARLLAFVRSKPNWATFANQLHGFFTDRGLAIDGIWFDFEVASFNEGDRPQIEALLHAVADRFGQDGKYVAFAAAPDTTGSVAHHFLSHPASLGQYPNILVRPMSYDTRPGTSDTGATLVCKPGAPIQATALDKVLDRCLTAYGLHPAQVQLGTGLCENVSNAHTRNLLTTWSQKLRSTRAGLIHWNLQDTKDADTYEICDRNLNGDGATVFIARATFGQPIQAPFNQHRIAAMNAHLPADQQLTGWVDPL